MMDIPRERFDDIVDRLEDIKMEILRRAAEQPLTIRESGTGVLCSMLDSAKAQVQNVNFFLESVTRR